MDIEANVCDLSHAVIDFGTGIKTCQDDLKMKYGECRIDFIQMK